MANFFDKNSRWATILSFLILALTIIASPFISSHLLFGIPIIILWWYLGCILFMYFLWLGVGTHDT